MNRTHLEPLVTLSTQLHLLNLFGADETPYEASLAVVSCRIKPRPDAFLGTRARAGKNGGGGGRREEAKLGIPMTKKYLQSSS